MTDDVLPRHARDMTDRERSAALDRMRADARKAKAAADTDRFMHGLRLKYPDVAARADAAKRKGA